jgi:hypothetical protein
MSVVLRCPPALVGQQGPPTRVAAFDSWRSLARGPLLVWARESSAIFWPTHFPPIPRTFHLPVSLFGLKNPFLRPGPPHLKDGAHRDGQGWPAMSGHPKML